MPFAQRRISIRIWIILLVALMLRLGWGLSRDSSATAIEQLPDQREYLEIGQNLIAGRGFYFYDPRFTAVQYAARTPGYPFFVAAFGAKPKLVRIGQAFLDASTVLAVYLMARRWLREMQSTFALLLMTFNPFLIYFSGLLLTETLYTAMLIWGMELCLRKWFVGCAILAMSIIVRPSGMLLPLGVGLFAFWANPDLRKSFPVRWPFPPATTIVMMCLLVLLPWAYRNYSLLGHWIWTSTNGGITKYDGWNEDATGASDQRFATKIPVIVGKSELERDDFFDQQATNYARQNPKHVLQLAGAKLLRMFSPVPLSAEFGKPIYCWIAGIYSVPVFLLALFGIWNQNIRRGVKMYLLLPVIYFALVHAMTIGSLRYRVPLEPLLAILAASSFHLPVNRFKRFEPVDG